MSGLARAMDANANRAREALRVMEDAARFALDDAALAGEAKGVRHALQGALRALPEGWLEANRDTPGDVGRELQGEHETHRVGHHAVVVAAGKRLGEALRSLEECLKTCAPEAARQVEALRYRGYALEGALALRMGSGARRQWRVCVLLTEALCARPWRDVAREAVAAGADAIQLREKDLPTRELVSRARELAAAAHAAGAALIVNDRVDVALASGADGAHLGQHDLPLRDARRIAGTALLLGASTHDDAEADAAVAEGADYCGVGAMFVSSTKGSVAAAGPEQLRRYLARHARVPHLAIGGITPGNVAQVAAVGGRGVAVSAAVCGASDPGAVVRALLQALPSSPCSGPTQAGAVSPGGTSPGAAATGTGRGP